MEQRQLANRSEKVTCGRLRSGLVCTALIYGNEAPRPCKTFTSGRLLQAARTNGLARHRMTQSNKKNKRTKEQFETGFPVQLCTQSSTRSTDPATEGCWMKETWANTEYERVMHTGISPLQSPIMLLAWPRKPPMAVEISSTRSNQSGRQ